MKAKAYTAPKSLGRAAFSPIQSVRYLDEDDAFEVEFASGKTYRVSHAEIRRANNLTGPAVEIDSVWIEAEMRAGFFVRYTDGSEADCAWDFVKEAVK